MPLTHWLRGRMDPSHTCGVQQNDTVSRTAPGECQAALGCWSAAASDYAAAADAWPPADRAARQAVS